MSQLTDQLAQYIANDPQLSQQVDEMVREYMEPVALVGTCKVCKWWDTRGWKGHGSCGRVKDDGSLASIEVEIGGWDYEMGSKDFVTPPNFACIQWESKE